MSATAATTLAETWLYQTLTADSTLSAVPIYSVVAPQNTTPPYIVYSALSGVDLAGPGMFRSMTTLQYVVKVVGATASLVDLDTYARHVDKALQAGTGLLAGGPILGCIRLNVLSLGVPDMGIQYRQIVQTYRLFVQETT